MLTAHLGIKEPFQHNLEEAKDFSLKPKTHMFLHSSEHPILKQQTTEQWIFPSFFILADISVRSAL